MGDRSKIEWTDASWNPIRARNKETGKVGWHCTHASEGCRNCYAESFNQRLGTRLDYKPGNEQLIDVFLDEEMLLAPLRWRRPRKIFVGSMTDLFADFVPDEWIDRIFAVMALCPQHTFQVLTKRSARMREYCAEAAKRIWPLACEVGQPGRALSRSLIAFGSPWPLTNVWLGVSAERQKEADERIPHLLETLSAVRFVSLEPLLGPVDLNEVTPNPLIFNAIHGMSRLLDWVIVGGESGPHARPMHPDWARSLLDQCVSSGCLFFFKQWGEWTPYIDRDRDDPDWRADYTLKRDQGRYRILNLAGGCGFHGERVHMMKRVGKKAAGRKLDGVEHDATPDANNG
jgi:protein gp37